MTAKAATLQSQPEADCRPSALPLATPRQPVKPHLPALRRFALAITILNLLGHTVLGFEQSWAQPLAALATAYTIEILLETVSAVIDGRRPRYTGGFGTKVDFLLSAHISGLACAMLIYSNDRIWPICFAVSVALGSKAIFRVKVTKGTRHVFNPSNFGITVSLVLIPWLGTSPYMFTENVFGAWKWLLPAIIVITGSFLNLRFTRRGPLIISWLAGFSCQALLRAYAFGTPMVAPFIPMTGMAFVLYTFYMLTDPATTPDNPRAQALFGISVATVYGTLVSNHITFPLFYSLTIVCAARGLILLAWPRTAAHNAIVVSREAVVTVARSDAEGVEELAPSR